MRLLSAAESVARSILINNRGPLDAVAARLEEVEALEGAELEESLAGVVRRSGELHATWEAGRHHYDPDASGWSIPRD